MGSDSAGYWFHYFVEARREKERKSERERESGKQQANKLDRDDGWMAECALLFLSSSVPG